MRPAPRGPVEIPSPGGGPLDTDDSCFHCQGNLAEGSSRIAVRTATAEVSILLCRSCQRLRQGGKLPVEMLLQQWYYSQGQREAPVDLLAGHQVSLLCLGCDTELASLPTVNPGAGPLMLANSRRMPDGSTVVPCAKCGRTNVLEGRSSQLVAVRLW